MEKVEWRMRKEKQIFCFAKVLFFQKSLRDDFPFILFDVK